MIRALWHDRRGNSVTEFAFLGPIFLMMIFLILDGGRMLFTKQALNSLTAASARCLGLHPSGCTSATTISAWAKTRALLYRLSPSQIVVTGTPSTSCDGASGMAKVVIQLTYSQGALNLLPQSVVPASFTATACYPVTS